MITPTNEEINRLCAEVCGWYISGGAWHTPDGNWRGMHPNFCEDRNALHELLRQLYIQENDTQTVAEFNAYLREFPFPEHLRYLDSWTLHVLLIPPRAIATAALRALGKWPDDWFTEEPEK